MMLSRNLIYTDLILGREFVGLSIHRKMRRGQPLFCHDCREGLPFRFRCGGLGSHDPDSAVAKAQTESNPSDMKKPLGVCPCFDSKGFY